MAAPMEFPLLAELLTGICHDARRHHVDRLLGAGRRHGRGEWRNMEWVPPHEFFWREFPRRTNGTDCRLTLRLSQLFPQSGQVVSQIVDRRPGRGHFPFRPPQLLTQVGQGPHRHLGRLPLEGEKLPGVLQRRGGGRVTDSPLGELGDRALELIQLLPKAPALVP